MRQLLWILCWMVVGSLKVTFEVCPGKETLVYPEEDVEYISYSCQCLKSISVCSQDLTIRFKELVKYESLYYEISEPLFTQQYESLQTEEVSSNVSISFKGIGSEKLLYFEYQNQQTEIHFSFVNQTVVDSGSSAQPFDASYIILSAAVSILVLFLSNYVRIHRFDALSVQWWFALAYVGVFTVYILVMELTNGTSIKYIQYVLVGGMSIFGSFFIISELCFAAGLKFKIWRIDSREIVGLLITGGLVAWRIESGNKWYINDIFSIVIVASLIKIFRVRSLRASLFFFVVTSTVQIGLEVWYILKHSRIGLKVINQYPSPLELQIPLLAYFATKRCAWVEFTDLLFPALLVSYCRRLDASFNISVYSIVATTCTFLALGLQICTYVGTSYAVELPQSVYSTPLLLLFLFAVSSRRGQWSIVWYGGFHDKMAERVSLAKSVEWESLTKDMEKNLMVN